MSQVLVRHLLKSLSAIYCIKVKMSFNILNYILKTTPEDGNVYETCKKVMAENHIETETSKKILFFGDEGTGKTTTFRKLSGLRKNQIDDMNDVNLLCTDTHANQTSSGEDVPLCRILQYDENQNIINIHVTVRQPENTSQDPGDAGVFTVTKEALRSFYILIFILSVVLRPRLDIYSVLLLLFVIRDQYINKRLLDTISPMGMVLSLQGIRVLGLNDGETIYEMIQYIPCYILVVVLLMFFLGVEHQFGGSLGYTIGLCLIIFPMNENRHQEDNTQLYVNKIFCCVLSFVKFMIRNKYRPIQFGSSFDVLQWIAFPFAAFLCSQFTFLLDFRLLIIIFTDTIADILYNFGIEYNLTSVSVERKTPSKVIISVFYFIYGFFCVYKPKLGIGTDLFLIYISVGVLLLIHAFAFRTEADNIYEKYKYPTMYSSEFLGLHKLSLWKFDGASPSDPLPRDAICLLFFNTMEAVKDPQNQIKILHKWLNVITNQSRRRNIAVFCIGTRSGSILKKELEEFAITLFSKLIRNTFSNTVIMNKDGLPVFYVENGEENNQGLEILKRKIIKEVK